MEEVYKYSSWNTSGYYCITIVFTQSRYRRFSLAPWHPSGLLNFTLRKRAYFMYYVPLM